MMINKIVQKFNSEWRISMKSNRLLLSCAVAMLSMLAVTPTAQATASKVTIQAIKVCNDDGSNCASADTYESYADKIWAQAEIDFVFLPSLVWNSTYANTYDTSGDDFGSLLALGTSTFTPASNVLNMYFVEDLITDPGFVLYGYGCGAPIFSVFCGGQTGVVINSTAVDAFGTIGRIDTVAHEVGHVLGLTHGGFGAGGGDNLMTSGGSRTVPQALGDINPDGLLLSKLTTAQINEALDSSFVTAVPEPEIYAMLGIGLGLMGWVGRRRSASISA